MDEILFLIGFESLCDVSSVESSPRNSLPASVQSAPRLHSSHSLIDDNDTDSVISIPKVAV